MELKLSTAKNEMVFLVDETDGKTGLAGLTLTITASKNGGAFGSISPTVTDRGSGWYNIAFTTSHTDTLGNLALHITATGADPLDVKWEVVTRLAGDAWAEVIPDSVAALGSRPTPLQALLMLTRYMVTARDSVSGLLTAYKEDGATPSMTFTQNSTTSVTRYERAS